MIKTYFGPMGSGKTKIALDLFKKFEKNYYKNRTMFFSPKKDNRHGVGIIKDRSTNREVKSIAIDDVLEIENYLTPTTTRVFIDEVNFFESEVSRKKGINSVKQLEIRRRDRMRWMLQTSLEKRIEFYLFGLNLTAELMPYGLMSTAINMAQEKHQLYAECAGCIVDKAEYSYFIPYVKRTNKIGDHDYCAMCFHCYLKWGNMFKDLKENNLGEYFKEAKILKPELEEISKSEDKKLIKTIPKWYLEN